MNSDEERGFRRGFDEGVLLTCVWAWVMFLVVIPWLASVVR